MISDQQQRIKTLFFAVRTMAPDQRGAFLDRECSDEPAVRAEVESLLENLERPTPALLKTPPPSQRISPAAPAPGEGSSIGHYRLIKSIGRGGMGMVYLAEQENPHRQVALKVISVGYTSEVSLKRFEHEAQVLGRLQHPGVAQIFEAGTFDLGDGPQPFFAMEYIDGLPLTAYAEINHLDLRQRLDLMVKVCEAIHHAHQKGVIHRDLKPGNILVDSHGQPKVLDFGIARVTDSDLRRTTLRTDVGQLMGTVQYMSPEQAASNPHDLDTRSDVYALGVVCYELLAGRLPHDLQQKALHEATRIIREDDPTPLSAINRVFRGDVDTILAKALEKDRERRYQSASEFADDIQRYLNDEAVVARPPSWRYQAAKFARRNKALVGGVAAVIIALVAGLATTLYGFRQAVIARNAERQQKDVAQQRASELAKVVGFQAHMLSGFDQEAMGLQWRDDALDEARKAMIRAGLAEAQADVRVGELRAMLVGTDFTRPAVDSIDRNFIQKALAEIDSQFTDQPLVQAALLQTVAITLSAIGKFESAYDPQSRALETRRKLLGENALDTFVSENEMGLLLSNLNRLPEAEEYFRNALVNAQFQFGEANVEAIRVIHNLGNTLQKEGKYDEAEKLLGQALAGCKSVYGETHADTLSAMQSIGELQWTVGKYEDARQTFEKVLAGRRKTLGEDDPETLASMQGLGMALRSLDRRDEALPYLRDSLERRRKVLGSDHRLTLMALINYCTLLQELGRAADALPYSLEALESYKRIKGPTFIDTCGAMLTHGVLLSSVGQKEEGLSYIRQALEGSRNQLDQNPMVAISASINLCKGLSGLGRNDEALPVCEEAYKLCQQILSNDHQYTLVAQYTLAATLSAVGQHDRAIEMAKQSADALIKAFTADHQHAIIAQTTLGSVLLAAGRYSEAEGPTLDAATHALATMGPTHPIAVMCVQNAVKLYNAWNAAEPGKGFDQKAKGWRERLNASR